MTCGFLFMCTGYYRYDEGYTPEFAGAERFGGQIVHPQHWPEDLDYAGKRVVVIGSGATAVTLVPALAETRRARDDAAALAELRRLAAGRRPDRQGRAPRAAAEAAYAVVRWKNVLMTMLVFQLSRRRPKLRQAAGPARRRAPAAGRLRHRHALHAELQPVGPAHVPGARRRPVRGDLRTGSASIVTDHIETFTRARAAAALGRSSSRPTSSSPPPGLNLLALGGMQLTVDGRPVDLPETMSYKGMMLSGVPNLALVVRLHERVVDAQVRPHLRATSAGCSTTWTRTATHTARRSTTTRR